MGLTDNQLGLLNTGVNAAAGLFGGLASGKSNAQTLQQAQQTRLDALRAQEAQRQQELFNTLLAGLKGQQGFESNLQDQNFARANAFQSANPLGSEQNYVKSNALKRGLLEAFSNTPTMNPTDPAVLAALGGRQTGIQEGFMNRPGIRQAFSDDATAQALADRRTATAGLDPRAASLQGSLAAYGLNPSATAGSTSYANQLLGDINSSNANQRQLLQNIVDQTQKQQQLASPYGDLSGTTAATSEPEKKSSIWKKIAKVGLAAAPFIAAPFTGGASLATGLIGAGAGAASGALDNGWKGAALGGAIGAIPIPGAKNAATATQVGAGAAIKNALLNPSALANIAGAGIGGYGGQAVQAGSKFLPGAKPYQTFNNTLASPYGNSGIPSGSALELQNTLSLPYAGYAPTVGQNSSSSPVSRTQPVRPSTSGLPYMAPVSSHSSSLPAIAPMSSHTAPPTLPSMAPVSSHSTPLYGGPNATMSAAPPQGLMGQAGDYASQLWNALSQQPAVRVMQSPQAQLALAGFGGGLVSAANQAERQALLNRTLFRPQPFQVPYGRTFPSMNAGASAQQIEAAKRAALQYLQFLQGR